MSDDMDISQEGRASAPRRTRRNLAAIGVAVSLALTPLGSVEAHRFRQSSTVSIRYDKPRFKGRVRSDRDFCKKNRRIVIHRVRPGKDPIVGRGNTNNRGRYSINPGPKVRKGKSYYAIAKRKKKKKHRHSHVCKRARSKTITI